MIYNDPLLTHFIFNIGCVLIGVALFSIAIGRRWILKEPIVIPLILSGALSGSAMVAVATLDTSISNETGYDNPDNDSVILGILFTAAILSSGSGVIYAISRSLKERKRQVVGIALRGDSINDISISNGEYERRADFSQIKVIVDQIAAQRASTGDIEKVGGLITSIIVNGTKITERTVFRVSDMMSWQFLLPIGLMFDRRAGDFFALTGSLPVIRKKKSGTLRLMPSFHAR